MAVIATGFFDGVHAGHRLVIDTLISEAKRLGEESMVITFWPHPRTVLQNGARELRLLTSLGEKKALLHSMGVDRVEVLDFTKEFSHLTAEQYLRDIVKARLGGSTIVLGYDNRMGSDGLTRDAIIPLAESLGLRVIGTPAILSSDQSFTVSSTKVREALQEGRVDDAGRMLGYRYVLHGVVVAGNQLGRTLGYPTANMKLYEPLKLIPKNGVYLVEVETIGNHYYGMCNIGVRPTVSASLERTLETHIFDFDELIYGLDIRISFVKRIRDEKRFSSLDELKAQLADDERISRQNLTR
ncbi:MAG: riboflavin biosynthesis protein RibF [Bacteroidales bacterium]|nr:riboflavin biosynthesis protein RibF [Bacteroidales bacterium]